MPVHQHDAAINKKLLPKAKELKARQKENYLHYPCTEFSVK